MEGIMVPRSHAINRSPLISYWSLWIREKSHDHSSGGRCRSWKSKFGSRSRDNYYIWIHVPFCFIFIRFVIDFSTMILRFIQFLIFHHVRKLTSAHRINPEVLAGPKKFEPGIDNVWFNYAYKIENIDSQMCPYN